MISGYALGTVLLALWIGFSGCSGKEASKNPDAKTTGRPPVAVEVTKVGPIDLIEGIEVVGTLSPKFSADVKSEYAGIVTEVYVTEWVRVKKGTPLTKIDTREIGLHEVLIYPDAFDDACRTTGGKEEAVLGMVGLDHLSGVMILSKPALLAGFDHPSGHHHVGVHEFAHLVEREEREYWIPPEVPWMAVRQGMRFVAQELAHPSRPRARLDGYAYTNEHEFFAVLAEYFFTSPASLERRSPALYALIRHLFHQDPRALLSLALRPPGGLGRNKALEPFLIIVGSLSASMVLFGAFVAAAGADPFEVYQTMYRAAFGTSFSWQNTLIRAAPLMLTALCTALPGYLGLIIISGEGAVVMGGLFAAIAALTIPDAPPMVVLTTMALSGMAAGAIWLTIGGALRHYRAVNETISSLLLNYIAIALLNHLVTSTSRDPESLNHPSTHHIGEANMIGLIHGTDLHWGLVFGIVACVLSWFLMHHTVFGFSSQIAGGNVRAAQIAGLPVGRLILIVCCVSGAAGGLAGMVEVAAIHGRANDTLNANYGYAGILVAFVARNNPLAIIPVAVLLGGIRASSGLLQRVHELPDATVLVMQGIIFLVILFSEKLYGRFSRMPKEGAV